MRQAPRYPVVPAGWTVDPDLWLTRPLRAGDRGAAWWSSTPGMDCHRFVAGRAVFAREAEHAQAFDAAAH